METSELRKSKSSGNAAVENRKEEEVLYKVSCQSVGGLTGGSSSDALGS